MFCDCLPHVFKLHFFLFNLSTTATGLKEGKGRGKGTWEEWGGVFSTFFYPSICCSINPVWCDSCQMQMSRPDMVSPRGTFDYMFSSQIKMGSWIVCACVCASIFRVADLDAVAVAKTVGITVIAQRREEKSSVVKCSFQSTTLAQVPICTRSQINRCTGGGVSITEKVSLCKQSSTVRPVIKIQVG